MATIYSTATNDTVFAIYKEKGDSKSVKAGVIKEAIVIGGHLSNDNTKQRGKFGVTDVTAEQLKLLKENKCFIRMTKNGFLSEKEPATAKKDKSAQLTEKAVKAKTKSEISTGKAEV